jgi:hypothetical protein
VTGLNANGTRRTSYDHLEAAGLQVSHAIQSLPDGDLDPQLKTLLRNEIESIVTSLNNLDRCIT